MVSRCHPYDCTVQISFQWPERTLDFRFNMSGNGFQTTPLRVIGIGTRWFWSLLMASLPATAADLDFFERRIRPVLAERCYECHSAQSKPLNSGLRLDTREGLLRGGESGQPAIVPGDAEQSRLIAAIRHTSRDLQMPPKARLSDSQIRDLVDWVNAGAPDPRADESSKSKVQSSKSPANAAKSHWAFIPPKPQSLPRVKDRSWPQTPVDQFILAKLEASRLKPSPPADPRTLIRRMTYDLTGLPPTAEEVEDFARAFTFSPPPPFPSATSERERGRKGEREQLAIATLVDRLLASPHYGERWARHWLDVARYSDTKGYVYGREERFFVHAWAYRDWVVRAFNTDLPYDQFLRLQIAADQLVPPTSPDLAAMGFLTGGRRFIGVTRDIIDDRIDAVTRGTMALTVQCARCHDHKYDPIPTADYYSLYGVFHGVNEQLVRLPGKAEDEAFEKELAKRSDKFAAMMKQRRDETSQRLRTRVGDYLAAQLEPHKYPEEGFDQILTADDIIPHSVRRWRDYLSHAADQSIFAPWSVLAKLPEKDFQARSGAALAAVLEQKESNLNPLIAGAFATPPKTMREAAERYGQVFSRVEEQWKAALAAAKTNNLAPPATLPVAGEEQLRRFLYDPRSPTHVPDVGIVDNEWYFPTAVCEELWKLQGEVDRWINQANSPPAHALILTDREPEPDPRVFIRGNPATRGAAVPRQFLGVVAGPGRKPFEHGSGRLELAQAITDPGNPLTARVMVNRLWQHHFGAGLVKTPSDFGQRAAPPSHSELLDWLALRFIESGWSLKAMHRLILTSAVYQQASGGEAIRDQPPVISSKQGTSLGRRSSPITAPLITDYSKRASALDPENRLLWRFNRQRLDLEQLRDSLLAASGELDLTPGGRPRDMFTGSNKRRSLYGLVDRQFLPAVFRAFDFANPDLHIPQRHETTVSQQSLFFLNHEWVAQRAKALSARLEGPAGDPQARVHALYQTLFQRAPTTKELAAALQFINESDLITPPAPPKPVESQWKYGWGEYDASAGRTKSFKPLPHYTGDAWQGAEKWPDAKLGWVQLTATGGHPGNDLQHASIRRWTAPHDCTVSIAGTLVNEPEAGDGVRGFIISSRHGELKAAEAHHSTRADMAVASVEVKAGDTLDFIVDIKKVLNSDQYLWAPVITTLNQPPAPIDNSTQSPTRVWSAKQDFAGPPEPYRPPLRPWEQYVQVLLLANEFMFVD
jgi:mono/diheme cytochrome c family protein